MKTQNLNIICIVLFLSCVAAVMATSYIPQPTTTNNVNLEEVRGTADFDHWSNKTREEVSQETFRRLNKIGQAALLYAADYDSDVIYPEQMLNREALRLSNYMDDKDPYNWYSPLIPSSLRKTTKIGFVLYMPMKDVKDDLLNMTSNRAQTYEYLKSDYPFLLDPWIDVHFGNKQVPAQVPVLKLDGTTTTITASSLWSRGLTKE